MRAIIPSIEFGMRQQKFIEPAELYQPEQNACVSCVVANVMYMSGKIAHPDVAAIDRELGRQPGQPLDMDTAYLYLLKQGFAMRFIDAFDEDAFIDRGLSYLQEFYADTWTGSAFDEYWTPEKVKERQRVRQALRSKFSLYSSQYESKKKTPSLNDIDQLLADNFAALIAVPGSNGAGRASLVYKKLGGLVYKMYEPLLPSISGKHYPTRLHVRRDTLGRRLLSEEGIAGIFIG